MGGFGLAGAGARGRARGSPVQRITVEYPDLRVSLLGWETHWLVAFLIFTLLFTLMLRTPLRVTI
ncbi:MAG: hypothetical protein O6851_08080 [Gemmatimonadetes bacterium]|nr:hypothetical protein [Gemmatimonadota bacterium]